jgi:hypothetical protein
MAAEKPTYYIVNWSSVFENAASRKVTKPAWVAIPNRHDTAGYARLMAHPNGAALYGAWIVLVQVASKMPARGILSNDSGPLDEFDMEARTRIPAAIFQELFQVLTDTKIGWLSCVAGSTSGSTGSTLPARYQCDGSTLPDRRDGLVVEGEGRGGKGSNTPPTPLGGKGGGGLLVCNGKVGRVTSSVVAERIVAALGMAPGPVAQQKSIEAVARRLAVVDLPNDKKLDLANELQSLAKEIGASQGIKNPPALWIKRASERIAEFEK